MTPGRPLRPQDIGGLLALGITTVTVAVAPRVGILSTGDEVVPPDQPIQPGQVRDINSYTLAGLTTRAGGAPVLYGIIPDNRAALEAAAAKAHAECDIVVLSAGSSVSYRDMSVDVIAGLGAPGVLVHGVSVRPGKPTIIAVAGGKTGLRAAGESGLGHGDLRPLCDADDSPVARHDDAAPAAGARPSGAQHRVHHRPGGLRASAAGNA
ncbi:MAG: molybdopterin-binding protein [Caldilineaceae bacterium]